MNKSKVLKIYQKLPFSGAADKLYHLIPRSVRNGRLYREKVKFLSRSQWWSKEELREYQFSELKKLLIHAYEHTVYYHRIFQENAFDPYQFSDFKELTAIPFLDKQIIQENYDDLIADNFPKRKRSERSTGGTSGNQLHFIAGRNINQTEYPFIEAIWKRVGFEYEKELLAVLRNSLFAEGEYCRFEHRHNRLLLNNYHLNDHNIDRILNKICELKVHYLHTYPSAAYALADYIKRSNKKYNLQLRAILVTSENIYPGQKELIEEALGGRVFTFYGHSERACIAGWCEESDKYHLNSEYGYTELVADDGTVIQSPETLGEIVCTGFGNYAMPFIRYRTGDYASYCADQECKCGRHYTLLNDVEGRWRQEMLIRADGSTVSITALNMHSQIFRNVKSYQMIQEKPDEIIMQIIKSDQYSGDDESKIIEEFKKKLGHDFAIRIQYVDYIEKTTAGKHKYIVQKIPDRAF